MPIVLLVVPFPTAGLPSSLAFACSSARFRASSSSSRLRSYPNCFIRSSSTRARRSASAKSIGAAAFLAPSFAGRAEGAADVTLEPRRAPPSLARVAAEEMVREAVGPGDAGGVDPGGVGNAVPEAVRPRTGGLGLVAAGLGAKGFGLSQVAKKSSSVSGAVGAGDNVVVSAPSINIPSGYLQESVSHGCTMLTSISDG